MKIRKKIGNLGKDKLQQIVEAFIDDLEQGAVAVLEFLEVEDSLEFFEVEIDSEDRVISFTRRDGSHYLYNLKSETIDDLDIRIKSIEKFVESFGGVFETVESLEYSEVYLDEKEKVISGRKKDGTKVEKVGFETPRLNIDDVNVEGAKDFEERLNLETDKDGRILSYRRKDGTKVEKVGIETNHLDLTPEGMTDFQRALKEAGFKPGGAGNFSDTIDVELPEPKHYSMLNLIVDSLPLEDSDLSVGFAEYYDFSGNYFKKAIELAAQGQTSRTFARTGGKGNYTLDIVDGSEIKFGSWVPQDSFHLKGCSKDVTRSILPTSYKLAWKVMQHLNACPNRVLMDEDSITMMAATGDRITDWPTDARCLPDGFPCELYVNGDYWGLYSWQLKKHRKNYSMDKKDYKSFFIDADQLMSESCDDGFWLGDIWWTRFEIKNPKDLICMDGSAYDGDNPKELIDNTSPVYDSTNKKHKGSKQTKDIIKSFSTKYLEIRDAMYEEAANGAYKKDANGNFVPYNSLKAVGDTRYDLKSDLSSQKALFAEYFDVAACMLVYIFNCTMSNGDSILKNTLWGTYSDGKIAPFLWDLDAMYGHGWIGYTISPPTGSMWTGSYANSSWPLNLFWKLYESEIKAAYYELRREGIIGMDTWHDIMFRQWVDRIGETAYKRDIARWPETISYRENYTNTEYWQERYRIIGTEGRPLWNENDSYNTGDEVVLSMHEDTYNYMVYKAVKPSTGVCPVTKFYKDFPTVGGIYDSPKRMEKWMQEQLRLCDIALGYNE